MIARSRIAAISLPRMDLRSRLLVHRDLRGLALGQLIPVAADGSRRVQAHSMPDHQPVEETPQGGKCCFLVGMLA